MVGFQPLELKTFVQLQAQLTCMHRTMKLKTENKKPKCFFFLKEKGKVFQICCQTSSCPHETVLMDTKEIRKSSLLDSLSLHKEKRKEKKEKRKEVLLQKKGVDSSLSSFTVMLAARLLHVAFGMLKCIPSSSTLSSSLGLLLQKHVGFCQRLFLHLLT